MLGRLITKRERWHAERDTNRIVRPFEWGASFIADRVNGDDPRKLFGQYSQSVLQNSEAFYAPALIADYQLSGDYLTWTSQITTPSEENNTARARYFPIQRKQADLKKVCRSCSSPVERTKR